MGAPAALNESVGMMHRFSLPVRYPAADGIRGVACLMVLVAHAITMFSPKTAPYLAGSGKIGVWLFFVLSAFLLTNNLLRDGFNRHTLIAYSIGRFLRIFPLFIFSVFVYWLFGTAGINTWVDVGDAIFFQKGFSHLWTVPVEFKFYIWLPFVVYAFFIANRVGGLSLAFLLFVSVMVGQQMIWPYANAPINTLNLGYYFITFVTGVALAIIMKASKTSYSHRVVTMVGVAVIFVILLSTPGTRYILFGFPLDYSLSNWFVYFGFIWSFFIYFTLNLKGVYCGLLVSPLLRSLGAWSYPIYLFHWLIYMKLIEVWPESFVAMLAGIIGAIVIGAIVHHFLELPIESFRKKLQNRIIKSTNRN